jgi:ferrous iron transport protein A
MSHKAVHLNELSIGKKGVISSILSVGSERRRLFDLGLIKGTKIEAIYKSPFGSPTAYFVRGTVIAFRDECTQNIVINI